MKEKDKIIDARNARIRELDSFISDIINSKGWQALEKLRNIKKKILKKQYINRYTKITLANFKNQLYNKHVKKFTCFFGGNL